MRSFLVLVCCAVVSAGPLTAGRAGDAKKKLLRERGGNAATEKAVRGALTWLAIHQGEDGSWDADGFMDVQECECDGKGGGWHGERKPCPFDVEITALATLAFLGAGESHREGEHKETVARAIAWLRRSGQSRTLFATAYTTRALAEAYDLTGDGELKDDVQAGVATMLESQQPQGGWRYSPGSRWSSGVPTSTAVACALRVSEEASFRVPDDYRKPLLELYTRLVDRETGRVKYTLDAHKMGYTPTTTNAASAMLVRAWMGQPATHREVALASKAVMKRKPKWSIKWRTMKVNGVRRRVQIGYLQHYYWWHATEALARLRSPSWPAWNGALKKALLRKQRKSGHPAGSWDPAGTYGPVGGRVFSTALCAMMLESYYRYP